RVGTTRQNVELMPYPGSRRGASCLPTLLVGVTVDRLDHEPGDAGERSNGGAEVHGRRRVGLAVELILQGVIHEPEQEQAQADPERGRQPAGVFVHLPPSECWEVAEQV